MAIYLSDPLAQPLLATHATNPAATPGNKPARLGFPGSAHSQASPFDLPSAARPGMMRSKTDSHVYTGSPVSRRKVGEVDTMPI
jgi:hypothetical protein